MKCTAHCIAASLHFQPLIEHLRQKFGAVNLFREVAFFQGPGGQGHVFVFVYGVVVFWAVDQQEELLKLIEPFAAQVLEQPTTDRFSFSLGNRFKVVHDEIILDSNDPLVMLSLSYAFAQSVKLEVFEARVQQAVSSAQKLVDQLSQRGRIRLSRRAIAKRLGWLMQQRYSINLHCDVLDTPDFFWDSSELERYYKAGISYLDLSQRVTVLHRRLDSASEIFEVLTTEMNHRHSSLLEWIIIILILIEILMNIATHGFELSSGLVT